MQTHGALQLAADHLRLRPHLAMLREGLDLAMNPLRVRLTAGFAPCLRALELPFCTDDLVTVWILALLAVASDSVVSQPAGFAPARANGDILLAIVVGTGCGAGGRSPR